MLGNIPFNPRFSILRYKVWQQFFALVHAVALIWLVPADGLHAQTQLDYRQRKELKDAVYYLRQLEANLDLVRQQVAAADAKTAPQAQANIDGLNKHLKYANDRLTKLPSDNPEVKAANERASAAAKTIGKLQQQLNTAVAETADAVEDEAQQLANDIDKLKAWGALFANPKYQFDNRLDEALAAASHLEQVEGEIAAIENRWPRLFDRKNRDRAARDLKAARGYFDRSFPPFKQYVEGLRPTLPDRMRSHLEQITTMVQTAVAEKRHLYFTGGIPQQIERAQRTLKTFRALDPAGAQPFADEMTALDKKIHTAQQDLSESIIQGNQVPQRNYAGPDVEKLRRLARDAWIKANPNDKILKIVFNTPGWSRVTRWQWSEGYKAWQKVDYSKIQPKIIVAHNDRLATVYPIDIYKDHLKADRVHATPWEKEENPDLRMLVLLERVK